MVFTPRGSPNQGVADEESVTSDTLTHESSVAYLSDKVQLRSLAWGEILISGEPQRKQNEN